MDDLIKLERQKEGQRKRILALIEKGIYKQPIVEEIKCPYCDTLFSRQYTKIERLSAPLRHGYCCRECYVASGEAKRQQAIGQQKRIEALQKNGTYHVPKEVSMNCKECGAVFTYDKTHPYLTQYLTLGYCSDECYAKSGEKNIQKYKTELNNCGVDSSNKTEEEIKELYSKYMSDRTRKSVDKWRATHYERYVKDNENYFSERSTKGNQTRRDEFLLENGLLTQEELNTTSEDEKQFLFRQHFNTTTKHGEKCIEGRMRKCENDTTKYKESYYKGLKKRVHNFLMKQYTQEELDALQEEEYCTIFDDAYQYLFRDMKKGKKSKGDIRKWKISHLIKQGYINSYCEMENLKDEDVDRLYGEYVSARMQVLSPSYNGFKRTLKGWYTFKNKVEFFYRSSWELRTCEFLNEILEDHLEVVEVPEPIAYIWENKKRHYFPDIKVKYKNGRVITFEIKPLRRTKDEINQIKFKAAMDIYGDDFVVLTENEIYSDNFKNLLISYGKK